MNTPETTSQPSNRLELNDLIGNQASLIDQIQKALACLGYAQLNGIGCLAEGDEVTLTGHLDSFYLKQVAQTVAIKVPGVKKVKNEILVR